MAYDEELSERIRRLLKPMSDEIIEKKMFGGISFLYRGKMTVGIVKNELCVRYLESEHPGLLEEEFVRPMDFTGKPMKEMAFVSPEAFENDSDLMRWIKMGLAHAHSKI